MIHQLLLILKRRFLLGLIVFLVVFATFYTVFKFCPKVYESHTSIYVQREIPNQYKAENYSDIKDHVRLMKSDVVLNYVLKHLAKDFPKHQALTNEKLMERLLVDVGVSSSVGGMGYTPKVIDLKFQDSDPKYAAAVLSYVLEGYDQTLRQFTKETKAKSIELMQQRLLKVRTEKAKLALKLEKLQADSGTTDIDIKNAELVRISSVYMQQLGEADAKLNALKSETGNLQKMLGLSSREIRAMAQLKEDPEIKALQTQLATEQGALTDLNSRYTSNYRGVVEKKRIVDQLEKMIESKAKVIFGGPINSKRMAYSPIDQSLGQKLLDKNLEYGALLRQKQHYEHYLSSIPEDFKQVAFEKREIAELTFRLETLVNEENKIYGVIQDENIVLTQLDNISSYMVITPATVPGLQEYIFPLQPAYLIISGFAVSLLLALFAMGLYEYISPTLYSLESLTILGKVHGSQTALDDTDIENVYQNVALLINRYKLKSISLFHLLNPQGMSKRIIPAYSAKIFGEKLAFLFSQRDIKTLLIDCMANAVDDEGLVPQVGKPVYKIYKMNANLHVLRREDNPTYFDPNIMRQIPDYDSYELVLVNNAAYSDQLKTYLIGEATDATIVGISKAKTDKQTIENFQSTVTRRNINHLGSVVFP